MKSLIICFLFVYCITCAKSELNARCTTPDNKMGRCEQFSKCDDLSKLYAQKKNWTTTQVTFINASKCGFLDEDLGRCGGSIITRRFILTAASCLIDFGNQQLTSVVLGEHDTTTDPDISIFGDVADKIQKHNISKIIVHEDYNKMKRFEHDIGLVKLTKNIIYSEWIKPICIPNSETIRNRNLVGYTIVESGWGGKGYFSASSVKKSADLDVKSNEQCQTCYNNLSKIFGYKMQITNFHFCAGNFWSSCKGDNGGPAIALEKIGDTIYTYLAGIFLYGPADCGVFICDGVFTKVAAYIPWIEINTI